MFLIIPTAAYKDEWACYALTNAANETLHVDIVRFKNVATLDGVDLGALPAEVYLTVIDHDVDRLKLANRMIEKFQWRINEIVKGWSHGNKRYGNPVICIETGEQWPSVKACSEANRISYSQLNNHLNGMIGYKTVKGKTYRRAT